MWSRRSLRSLAPALRPPLPPAVPTRTRETSQRRAISQLRPLVKIEDRPFSPDPWVLSLATRASLITIMTSPNWSVSTGNAGVKYLAYRRLLAAGTVPANYVYVGRISRDRTGGVTIPGSVLANQFSGPRYSLQQALQAYYDWITDPTEDVEAELQRISWLANPVVLCWCTDANYCHARMVANEVMIRRLARE